MYRLTASASIVQRISDGAAIPVDLENADYRAYLAWVLEGNTATPYAPPSVPEGRAPCTPLYARREILTQQEIETLTALGMTNAGIRLLLDELIASSEILPNDPGLVGGLAQLVAAGIFTSQRRDAILAAVQVGMPAHWGAAGS